MNITKQIETPLTSIQSKISFAEPLNVLVVDDSATERALLKAMLERFGLLVIEACDAQAALDYLQTTQDSIDLILMDIQMPDISGFDLMQKVREDSRWQHLPIIAVTAHAMSGDQERIIASGFDGYIPKPINTMTLVDELKGFFDAKNG